MISPLFVWMDNPLGIKLLTAKCQYVYSMCFYYHCCCRFAAPVICESYVGLVLRHPMCTVWLSSLSLLRAMLCYYTMHTLCAVHWSSCVCRLCRLFRMSSRRRQRFGWCSRVPWYCCCFSILLFSWNYCVSDDVSCT